MPSLVGSRPRGALLNLRIERLTNSRENVCPLDSKNEREDIGQRFSREIGRGHCVADVSSLRLRMCVRKLVALHEIVRLD